MELKGKAEILQVRILYSEGCANTPPTVELVKKVAQELNVSIRVDMIAVRTLEEAQELRFLGSPTVQIDGIDIEPSSLDNPIFGLT
jgi:3-keto-L-gulonate-6-phosphate decarboxylase